MKNIEKIGDKKLMMKWKSIVNSHLYEDSSLCLSPQKRLHSGHTSSNNLNNSALSNNRSNTSDNESFSHSPTKRSNFKANTFFSPGFTGMNIKKLQEDNFNNNNY